VVQQPEFGLLERLLGYPLQPVILLLDGADPHGFRRDWQPVYGVTPDKHRAYAAQWFTMALVLVLIYIGVNTRRIANDGMNEQ
jgi:surfeit locus 1 family protein